jgi:predicted nucleic acid-binding protein
VKVVSDTSPICYLLLIGHVEILPALFERVHIPPAVRDELSHPGAASVVRSWIASPPAWLQVHTSPRPAVDLGRLHSGEREAIALAEEIRADAVLLDEKRARQAAGERGLAVMGLLGVLDRAAEAGLVPLADALDRLARTSFRVEPRLIKAVLDRHLGGRTAPVSEQE